MKATSGITGSRLACAAVQARTPDDLLPLPGLGITLRVVPYSEWAACPPSARRAAEAALPRQDGTAWQPGPLAIVTTAALTACSTVSHPSPWAVRPASRIETATKTATLDPTSADVQTARGVALARDGQPAAAVAAFRQAAALHPGSARALNNLGHALALAGQVHEAAEVLRMALAVDPRHARARLNLAEVERRLHVAPATIPPASAATASRTLEMTPLPTTTLAVAPTLDTPPVPAQVRPEPFPAGLNPVRLVVVNGVGIDRAASRIAGLLRHQGTPMTAKPRLQNLLPYRVRTTEVQFRKGFQAEAAAIAGRLQQKAQLKEVASDAIPGDVRVVLGHDQRPWLAARSQVSPYYAL